MTTSDVDRAIETVKDEFPFGPGYLEGSERKIHRLVDLVASNTESDPRVLSIGSGPCDVEAVLSQIGYSVTAVDDLADQWHLIGENQRRIKTFAEEMGVDFQQKHLSAGGSPDLGEFDIVLSLDVIEHLTQPREFLNVCASQLAPSGVLIVLTPNGLHLADRLRVLFGRSMEIDAEFLYWNVGRYRSHVKEYSVSELKQLHEWHGLDIVETVTMNKATREIAAATNNPLFRVALQVYSAVTAPFPNLQDTQIVVSRRPEDWTPVQPSISRFKERYTHLAEYNLDGLSDDEIRDAILSHDFEESRDD